MLDALKRQEEVFWLNPKKVPFAIANKTCELSMTDVLSAEARWQRFAAFFKKAYPETEQTRGIIESPFRVLFGMKEALEKESGASILGKLCIKLDSHLPISGSIKARGGVYEVLMAKENENATHLVWATGGNMVPDSVMENYYKKGKEEKKQ